MSVLIYTAQLPGRLLPSLISVDGGGDMFAPVELIKAALPGLTALTFVGVFGSTHHIVHQSLRLGPAIPRKKAKRVEAARQERTA